MNLSEHFTLAELTRSHIAVRMGQEVVPTERQLLNLQRLCMYVLEPIRARVRCPIIVSSGLRPNWLNVLTGGSLTSDHIPGLAADIEAVGMSPFQLAREVVEILPALPIKQLILEFPPHGWVHVSVTPEGVEPEREVLTARRVGGRTHYLPGLQYTTGVAA